MGEKLSTLEGKLALLLERAKQSPTVPIRDVLFLLSGKGRALLIMVLALPFCQPIQIPGFSTPFGLVIAVIGVRMAIGRQIVRPASLLSKQISSVKLTKIAERTHYLIKKLHRFVHPRLHWACAGTLMTRLNGFFIAILGLFLALPLPIPFSNMVVAWAIFFLAFGVLENDGLLILIGYTIVFVALIIAIWGMTQIKELITS